MTKKRSKLATLTDRIVEWIRSGEWAPGQKLPGGRELARTLRCSTGTMERVLRDLMAQGYLVREERSGTYVAGPETWGCGNPPAGQRRLVGVLGSCPAAMLEAMDTEMNAHGFGLLLRHTAGGLDEATESAEALIAQGVSGFLWALLVTPDQDRDNLRLASVLQKMAPVVAVDRYPRGIEVDCVISDNIRSGGLLTRRMLEMGHRRIGLIRHKQGSTPEDRHQGYSQALLEAGIEEDPALVFKTTHNIAPHELVGHLQAWLRKEEPTAIFSINGDPLGAAVYAAALSEGLRVPEDLSIATFDGFVAPIPIDTILQPMAEIGRRAAELLCRRITDPSGEIERITLPCTFRPGASSAPPAKR